MNHWTQATSDFLKTLRTDDGFTASSVPGGAITLYGTCYVSLARHYLGQQEPLSRGTTDFIKGCQDASSGLLVGPELRGFEPPSTAMHDLEHLQLHSTCSVLPLCQQFHLELSPIVDAHRFCDLDYLDCWIRARNWKSAWFEGNNILFVGQLLIYLRDIEQHPGAQTALDAWFRWLDTAADPQTGLWGTNGFCSPMEAVYGGYHQLLVYYHEDHLLPNPRGLVDTVLSLQHRDGGFNPRGNGGACEDVDSVDILVNCYKRFDYRRPEIRVALRRCGRHIISTQNADGGFPYNRDLPQSHMGIPGTSAAANVSTAFATWFRIHTLALINEIVPDEAMFDGCNFQFNKALSMGWHASPPGWTLKVPSLQRLKESWYVASSHGHHAARYSRRRAAAAAKKALSSAGVTR